jgi:hypothetical protein
MQDNANGFCDESRRQWFATMGRWGALAGLAVLTGRLVMRDAPTADCGRQFPCQRCGLLARCDLPRAAQTRRDETRSL